MTVQQPTPCSAAVPRRLPTELWRQALFVALVIWSVSFAGLSAYWAAGGSFFLEGLSPWIRELAVDRSASFIAIVWASVALKLAYAGLALCMRSTCQRPSRRRVLHSFGWVMGAFTILYSIAEAATAVMSSGAWTNWYLLVWDPVWLLGGVLTLALLRVHRQDCPRESRGCAVGEEA